MLMVAWSVRREETVTALNDALTVTRFSHPHLEGGIAELDREL